MAIGDSSDMWGRLKNLLPAGWFGDNNPIRDALLWGYANALAWGYTLYLYAKDQTRIKSATDGWLDLIGLDFFGNNLVRYANQTDTSYRNRILINIFRERTTRHAMEQVLLDLTGRSPIIIEPARPADVGAYGAAVAVSQPGTTTMIDNGMIVYVPPNTPRYQAGQLLVEAASTNLLKYSGQLDNLAWGKVGSTVSADAITSPDGSLSGDMVVESVTLNNHHVQMPATFVAGDNYAISMFAKAGSRSILQITVGSAAFPALPTANFDLLSGTISVVSGGAVAAINSLGGGWYRCTISAVAGISASTVATFMMQISPTAGRYAQYTGDGVSGLYMWGAQIEGGQLSSYIPTSAVTVTRATDTLLNNMPAGSIAIGGYGAAGAYGSISLPYQAFVTAFRPLGQGLPFVSGYGISTGAYSTPSRSAYGQLSGGDVTDADIYAAIDATKPIGTVAWTRISS
jgi:hypothetical protein